MDPAFTPLLTRLTSTIFIFHADSPYMLPSAKSLAGSAVPADSICCSKNLRQRVISNEADMQ